MKITKKNIKDILSKVNSFEGKVINTIKYDIDKDKIDITIDKVKLTLKRIKECDIREYFSWEIIEECYLEQVQFNNQDSYCFATSKTDPTIYVVCDEISINIKEDK